VPEIVQSDSSVFKLWAVKGSGIFT